MNIVFCCNDTRGGIQPYVGLGMALAKAGHKVRIVAPAPFGGFVQSSGLDFAPLSVAEEELRRLTGGVAERGTLATVRLMLQELPKRVVTWARETLDGVADADVVVAGMGGMVTGLPAAEKLGVPFLAAHLQPIGLPSTNYPGVLVAGLPVWRGALLRRASHFVSDGLIAAQFGGAMSMARKALGLGKGDPSRVARTVLYGFSRHVVPAPVRPDRILAGYWTTNESEWSPPADLLEFVTSREEPIVSVGFGSMVSKNPERLADLVAKVAERAGCSVVLLSDSGGLSNSVSTRVHASPAIPHQWLFPRMNAVVHHGGAGTTGAGFLAGVPQIVIPFAVDQPFWASRVFDLGVGPRPIPRRKLTEEMLTRAINDALPHEAMKQRADTLGIQIRGEQSLDVASKVIDAVGER
jgi:sterol 3beta-glucosyltransferase